MKKVIRLTESDLTRIVKRVIKEDQSKLAEFEDRSVGLFMELKRVAFKLNEIANEYEKLSEEAHSLLDMDSSEFSSDDHEIEGLAASAYYNSELIFNFLQELDIDPEQ
jgi:hypothetical protein